MDDLLTTVIGQLPNVAVAVLALWWLGGRLDRLLDLMSQMLMLLLEAVLDEDDPDHQAGSRLT